MEPRTNSLPYGNSGNYSLIRDYLRKLIGGGVKSPFDMIRKSPWMPRPSTDQGFNRPMPSPEPVMNGDDGVFGDRPKYTRPFMPSPINKESQYGYEPWIEQGISYEEYVRRMNGEMDGGNQYQPMPVQDPEQIRATQPWMPNPQPNSDITTRPISNQIGPGFGQPMPSNGLYDTIKNLIGAPQQPSRPRGFQPWNEPGGIAGNMGEDYLKQNPYLGPSKGNTGYSYPAFPSIPGGSIQPSLPRQPRISQESFNNKPIASWM